MTLVTLLGAIWAWRRQVHHLSMGPAAEEAPQRTELVFLCSMFASLLGTLIFFAFQNPGRFELGWNLMIVLTLGVGVATLWKLYRTFVPSRSLLLPRSTEGIVLTIALLPSILYAGLRETTMQYGGSGNMEVRWEFISQDNGVFVSAPLIDGERVYIAAAHPAFKVGTLHCLHRWTGTKLWNEDFIGDGEFKQVFSSPAIADGKIYIGEGFHDDANCKVYAIDANTGQLAWKFQTTSQVESSPSVANGKVYFGGGNDGFYCLDAKTKDVVWQYPPAGEKKGRLRRFGASPLVMGGKVYVGTGVDRNHPEDPGETAVFCFDADTGKLWWKEGVDLPAWAAPVLEGDRLFVTLGNGDVFSDATNAPPAGAALCLNAATGKVLWRTPVPNGVLERPAVDEQHVYFGSRDHHCYALGKSKGDVVWKTTMESPVIAGVVLARSENKTKGVYVVGSEGKIACLHPANGQELRSFRLQGQVHLSCTPRLVTQRFPEGERHHLFLGAGMGDIVTGKAVLFCLEDRAPRD
jgi:outer membrane protein assembly factor BamB